MSFEVKNPIYLFLFNWVLLIIGYLGIPLISLDGTTIGQQYILSFIIMNFNFFSVNSNLLVLVLSWSISITLFGVFMKKDWKIPLYALISEVFVYLFSIILIKRNSPITYSLIKLDLFKGFCIAGGIILFLYIPILVHILLNKMKKKIEVKVVMDKPISICPHCGTEYHSNPKICFSCSKHINPS